ncbi:MAG: hypothetical protein ACP5Q4_09115, partial [Candidatus Caldatribacteriaceae bacterium]
MKMSTCPVGRAFSPRISSKSWGGEARQAAGRKELLEVLWVREPLPDERLEEEFLQGKDFRRGGFTLQSEPGEKGFSIVVVKGGRFPLPEFSHLRYGLEGGLVGL